jgi:hypothetical protein
MAICPNGHDSVAADVCDACGTRIAPSSAANPARVVGKHHAGGPRPAGSPDDTCPWCGSQSSGQFCSRCGFRVRRPFGLLAGSQPPTEPRPAAEPQPATEPRPAGEPQSEAELQSEGQLPGGPDPPAASPGWSAAPPWSGATSWSSVPASPSPPDSPAPADPPTPPDLPAEAVLPGASDSYAWSAHQIEVPRPSAAAPTAPMPKFTAITWSVVVTADRTYYDQTRAERARTGSDLPFPARSTERRFALTGKQMRIGRRSPARGVEPEIDLSEPPVDPGISRLHALLLPAPDGSWAVLDPGSANGTRLNGREIPPGDLIPLRDGDCINLGAWTAITVHRG